MKKKERVTAAVFLLAAAAIMLPVLIGCGYTYIASDDFSFEGGGSDMARIHGMLKGPLLRTWQYCMTNEGSFWANFLVHFIRPYSLWGMIGHPWVMTLNALLFFLSLALVLRSLFKEYRVFFAGSLLAAVISAFLLAGTLNDKEIFFWYTGAMYYTIELTMMFVAIALSLWSMRAQKKANMIGGALAGALTGFLASGGNVMITGAGCAWLLLVLLFHLPHLKGKGICAAPFAGAVAGGLFNVFLPGNWIRLAGDATEGHASLLDAVRDTLRAYRAETAFILKSPLFLLLLVAVFALAFHCRVKIRENGMAFRWIILLFVSLWMLKLLIIFPACYGLHADYLARMRVIAVYEMIARWMYLFFAACLAQWAEENIEKKKFVRVLSGIAAVLLAVCCLFAWERTKADMKSGFSGSILADLRSGSMQENYLISAYVISSLGITPEGTDGIVYKPHVMLGQSTVSMDLSSDSEDFYNISAAGAFHLHTVTVLHP